MLHEVHGRFGHNCDGVTIHKAQEIETSFLDFLSDLRHESTHRREGEHHMVASVPAIVVEMWLNEGFNIYQAPMKDIVKRLKRDNLDAFLATRKSI